MASKCMTTVSMASEFRCAEDLIDARIVVGGVRGRLQKLEMGRIDRRGAASGALHTIAVQGEGGGGGLARAGVEGQGIVGSRA